MQSVSPSNPRSIDPHLLGPLDDESRSGTAPGALYSGAERFLGKGERKRRTALWNALADRLGRLCAEDEQVLYVAPAVQKIGVMNYLALGMLVMKYHQVALVITNTRVLEVLLEWDGKTIAERARSYALSRVAEAKLSMGKLVLKPTDGKAVYWHLQKRGDRKLLKLLLPKINERLLTGQSGAAEAWPVQHCASCGTALAAKPKQCDSCKTPLRSQGLAAALSLAFPGAGLFYAGHPVLGTFDLIGEGMVFLVLASMVLVAGSAAEVAVAVFAGLFLFAITKLESVHIGHVLVARGRSETTERRRRWSKGAMAGGAVSALALIAVLLGAGALAEGIERDLDFESGESVWVGTRDPSDWEFFPGDPDMRSQWQHEDGWVASVFAYPLAVGQTPGTFRQEFVAHENLIGATVLLDDESLPDGFDGFRIIESYSEQGDGPYVILHYFVHDPQGDDIHQMLMAVEPDSTREAESAMRGLLAQAQWIEAEPQTY